MRQHTRAAQVSNHLDHGALDEDEGKDMFSHEMFTKHCASRTRYV